MGPVEPSSHTTTHNPLFITYHNPQPPPRRMPQLPTPNSSHIATSTPQFIPCHNPQPGGADTSLCLTAHWKPVHPISTAYEFTDNEMAC